jgi:nitroreductase
MTTPLSLLIRTRRTIGAFTAQPIPAGVVESLLEIAVFAPNHRLTEPWRFVYLTGEGVKRYAEIRRDVALAGFKGDESARHQLAEGTYQKFAMLPAILIVINRINSNPSIAEEDYAATSCVIQNFMLLAWEQNIGSAWKTPKLFPELLAFIGVASDERMIGVIHLGYPSEAPVSQRTPAHTRITYIG